MRRRATTALAILALLCASACVSFNLEGASPAVRFYAAVNDYLTVKQAAAAYAMAPSTPHSHVLEILALVEPADREIDAIVAHLQTGALPSETRYDQAARILRLAIVRVAARLALETAP